MKLVNVTVRGGNTAEGATGVSFSVMPYEVVVQIPGSREPILSVPVVDNPLLNRQSYSFYVDGFEVDLEVVEVAEVCDGLVEEETIESETLSEEIVAEEEQEVLAEALGEPEPEELESAIETSHSALEVLLETSTESDVENGVLTEEIETPVAAVSEEVEAPEAIVAEETSLVEEPATATSPETPAEEEETAFFQRLEGGHEPAVDETEAVVPVAEEHNAEELRHLLEQTQALLQKYDMNNVEH